LLWRTISPDAQQSAGTVPVLKNVEILGFSEYSLMDASFINPKGWLFSPTFGIGDFLMLHDGQFAAKC
jgi:hypothetical protein